MRKIKQRHQHIDIFKGLLVIGMIYAHVLQFFTDFSIFSNAVIISDFINLITFSGFVFSFGYVCCLAYYRHNFLGKYKNMLLSGFKTLVAFYISGICYRVLIDGQVLTSDLIMNIIILEDIPGYSEFLVSFSLFIFIGMTLFKPLQMLIEHKKTFWMICILLLFTTFIPYENVSINPFGLLLGSTSFASFPVLQYLPFYLIGIYFARYQIHFNPRLFIGAIVCTMIFSFYLVSKGHLPSRFPPTFIWIIGPAFFLYIYYLLAKPLAKIGKWMKPIEFMGRNVLFYLLISNLFIFTLKGRQSILILSTFESLIVAIIIMLIIGYLIWIITKQGKKYVKT